MRPPEMPDDPIAAHAEKTFIAFDRFHEFHWVCELVALESILTPRQINEGFKAAWAELRKSWKSPKELEDSLRRSSNCFWTYWQALLLQDKELFSRAARNGHPTAAMMLGDLLEAEPGRGREAYEWHALAAEAGWRFSRERKAALESGMDAADRHKADENAFRTILAWDWSYQNGFLVGDAWMKYSDIRLAAERSGHDRPSS